MRFSADRWAGWACVVTLTGVLSARGSGLLGRLLPQHQVEVVVVTDTTPAGKARSPASPAQPVYYQAVSAGYHDFGGVIAGDRVPPQQQLLAVMAQVLAKQGYLPATPRHQPSLILIWAWGTMYADVVPAGSPDAPDRQINRRQLLRFMGAYKLGLVAPGPSGDVADEIMPVGAMIRDAESEQIYQWSEDDLYAVAISAYDYDAARHNRKVKLWTTKISCPAAGLAMDTTLPRMLTLAAPFIGRETDQPVALVANDHLQPEVVIGEAKVVAEPPAARAPGAAK